MTSFSEEEASRCMSCDEKPPEFRLIRLGKYLGKNRELIPDVSGTLLCTDCLGDELSEFHDSLGQVEEPVAETESEDSGLVRDYGLLVVPLDLSKEEAELLIEQLQTGGIEHKTH